MHRENIERVVSETFNQSGLSVQDVDAIAVTNRPGLQLSLLIGLRYAKYLARTHSKPIIPIHHMEAHALTVRMSQRNIDFPFLCLLASGGHCILAVVKGANEFYRLGETRDDAPGEAFDKIARELKLRHIAEYEWMSGGQAIEIAAKQSEDPERFEFPLPLARYRDCNFSFAGLKNTAKRAISRCERDHNVPSDAVMPYYQDFCSGFLRAITRHILHRTQRAMEYCEQEHIFPNRKSLVFSGGVACNEFIFTALSQLGVQFGFETFRPPPKHCTDNGLMIAWNGIEKWLADPLNCADFNLDQIRTEPKCPLGKNYIENVTNAALSCKWAKIPIMKTQKT